MIRLREAARLLTAAVEAGLTVWPEGSELVVKGPPRSAALAKRVLDSKDVLIPMLADRRFEIIDCPGESCDQSVLLIDSEGWCQAHQMSITVIERTCG